MSTIAKQELEKAVDELNDKICDPPIKKKDEKKMAKKILIAAKLIEKGDDISKETMATIKALKGSKPTKAKKNGKEAKSSSKPKKSKATKPTVSSNGTTRADGVHACVSRCKKGKSFNDLVKDIGSHLGGSASESSITSYLRVALSTLEKFEVVEHEEGLYTYKG
jgi:hypothetical protein|tara:strand:- start:135 stop:629 length:495 start_codon:yes stop_codon:yes gene_type:complete